MNASVTVSLPNDLFLKAEAWAKQSGRPVAEFLAEAIEHSLVPFASNPEVENALWHGGPRRDLQFPNCPLPTEN